MSSGSKKSKAPEIKAPPAISQTDYTLPTGDRFVNRSRGNTEYFESFLTPDSQKAVNDSLRGLQSLAGELQSPDQERMKQIQKRADDFYNLQAKGLNEIYDDRLKQTQSDLNKRFGGAYNATFGTDLMARLEKERASSLGDARQQANLLGEDFIQADEDSRLRRFTLFENFLNNLNAQATGISSVGSQVLGNERSRATEVAIKQAQLEQQNQALRMARSNTLLSFGTRALGTAALFAAPFTAGTSTALAAGLTAAGGALARG